MARPTHLAFPDATGSMLSNGDSFDFGGLGQGKPMGADSGTLTPETEGMLRGILVEVLGHVPDGCPATSTAIPRVPRHPRLVADALDEAFLRMEAATEARRAAWRPFRLVVLTDGGPDPAATDRIDSLRK